MSGVLLITGNEIKGELLLSLPGLEAANRSICLHWVDHLRMRYKRDWVVGGLGSWRRRLVADPRGPSPGPLRSLKIQ